MTVFSTTELYRLEFDNSPTHKNVQETAQRNVNNKVQFLPENTQVLGLKYNKINIPERDKEFAHRIYFQQMENFQAIHDIYCKFARSYIFFFGMSLLGTHRK